MYNLQRGQLFFNIVRNIMHCLVGFEVECTEICFFRLQFFMNDSLLSVLLGKFIDVKHNFYVMHL